MKLNILEIQVVGDCNLECKNCSALVDFGFNKGYFISLEEIVEILKVAKKSNTTTIVITGGEAIMHPEIEQICQLCFDGGFYVWVNTNGILKKKISDLLRKFPKIVFKNTYKTSSVQPMFKNFHFNTKDILDIGGEVIKVRKPTECELSSRVIYHLGNYFMCCLGGMNDQLNGFNCGVKFIDEPINMELLREKQSILCSHCGEQGIRFTNPNKIDITTIGKKWRDKNGAN